MEYSMRLPVKEIRNRQVSTVQDLIKSIGENPSRSMAYHSMSTQISYTTVLSLVVELEADGFVLTTMNKNKRLLNLTGEGNRLYKVLEAKKNE